MKLTSLISIVIVLLTSQIIVAQDFQIPKNVQLEKESDYKKYEDAVLNGIMWLEKTNIEEQATKRVHTNAFVLQWIMGTPTFSIELSSFQIDLTEKNPELLTTFLGGWTKFAIENPTEKDDTIKANMEGFKSLMQVYMANRDSGMKKDKKIEKLIKLTPEALEKWVRKEVE